MLGVGVSSVNVLYSSWIVESFATTDSIPAAIVGCPQTAAPPLTPTTWREPMSIIHLFLEADLGFPELIIQNELAGADAGNVVGGQFAHGNVSLAVWNAGI